MMARLMFAVGVAAMLAVPAAAQVQKKDMPGIRNYSRVDATIGCGGATDPAAIAGLKGEGYISIINLRLPTEEGANVDAERASAQAASMKYIGLPFNVAAPDSKVVDAFLAAVADKSNQPVYIHCGSANRVGGMWMIKRVLQDKWAIDRATTEAEAIGLTSPDLKKFVAGYIAAHQ